MRDRTTRLATASLFRWAQEMARMLCENRPCETLRLVYVPRGGFVPAYLLALALEEAGLRVDPQPLDDAFPAGREHTCIVVDDIIDTGATCRKVLEKFGRNREEVKFAAPVCKGDWSSETDIVLCGAEECFPPNVWVVFPWEENWKD